jgi:hypothetical protein
MLNLKFRLTFYDNIKRNEYEYFFFSLKFSNIHNKVLDILKRYIMSDYTKNKNKKDYINKIKIRNEKDVNVAYIYDRIDIRILEIVGNCEACEFEEPGQLSHMEMGNCMFYEEDVKSAKKIVDI